ncbi:hypothetical protein Hanom_Chr07g00611501 [Helianthus anomalus]
MLIYDVLCTRCDIRYESCYHIIPSCLWTRSVWWHVFRWLKIPIVVEAVTVGQILEHIKEQVASKRWKKVVQMVVFGGFG